MLLNQAIFAYLSNTPLPYTYHVDLYPLPARGGLAGLGDI